MRQALLDRSRVHVGQGALVSCIAWIVAAVCALVVILNCIGRPVEPFDEAILLTNGALVLDGSVPHIGFWSLYPPMQYYLSAAAFSVMGRTVLALRLLQVAFFILLLLICGKLFQSHFRIGPISKPVSLLALSLCVGQSIQLAAWIPFVVAFTSLLVYLDSCRGEQRSLRRIFLSGLLAGLAILLRINFGGYVVIAVLADLALQWIERSPQPPAMQTRVLLARAAAFLAPIAILSATYMLRYGGRWFEVAYQVFLFPQRLMSTHRYIELPPTPWIFVAIAFPAMWTSLKAWKAGLKRIGLWLIPVAISAALCSIAYWCRATPAVITKLFAAAAVSVLFLDRFVLRLDRLERSLLLMFTLLLHYVLSRADALHFLLLFPVFATLLPYLVCEPKPCSADKAKGLRQYSRNNPFVVCFAAWAVLAITMHFESMPMDFSSVRASVALLSRAHWWDRKSDAERLFESKAESAAWANLYNDSEELQAVAYVRDRTVNTEPVYVGVADHSTVNMNVVRTQWLLGRKPGVKHHVFEPGLTTEADVQREMIGDMEWRAVRWVVLTPQYETDGQSERFPIGRRVRLMDDFLGRKFHETARFGNYSVLTAN